MTLRSMKIENVYSEIDKEIHQLHHPHPAHLVKLIGNRFDISTTGGWIE